jgi:hypothetical protein
MAADSVYTSHGTYSQNDFIRKCNEQSFPSGLQVTQDLFLEGCTSLKCLPKGLQANKSLYLRGCTSLTVLPYGLKVERWFDLLNCTSLKTLPAGLRVGGGLDIEGCTSLTALPVGLLVSGSIYTDIGFVTRYPFRDIPKILHLPFGSQVKKLLRERLQNGN